jgi:hypothetical protein
MEISHLRFTFERVTSAGIGESGGVLEYMNAQGENSLPFGFSVYYP